MIQNGSEKDLKNIKIILEKDPTKFTLTHFLKIMKKMLFNVRYMRSYSDPESFVNKTNKEGMTPLYVACLNGNFDVSN